MIVRYFSLNNIKKMDEFVFYKDRPDWQDIEPIPEFEPCPPIAPIDYSDMLVDIMGYFRAILLKEEISERAF